MFPKDIVPMAGLELGHGGVAIADHSVSALGSSMGTAMRCSEGAAMVNAM